MRPRQVIIEVDRKLVAAAQAGDTVALQKVINRCQEPFRKYVAAVLASPQPLYRVEERVLRIVWREALGKLEANLGDFRDQHPGEPDFAAGCFTPWAKGIADDCAFRCLIAALKRNEEWAWQTLREVHVHPQVKDKVPPDDVEDVVQEVLVRFKKAIAKYDPDYPGAKPSVVP